MSRISISFRVYSNANKTNQIIKVCARLEKSCQYHPRSLSICNLGNLKDYNVSKFNTKTQRFTPKSLNATENNSLLTSIEEMLNRIIKQHNPATTAEFWRLVETEALHNSDTFQYKTDTFGNFLERLIIDQKEARNNKLPSGNFRIYIPLFHYLQKEDEQPSSAHIIQTPIQKLSNYEFKVFGQFLRNLRNSNYLSIMKYFKRAHNHAIKLQLATNPLTYRYQDDKPPKTIEEMQKINKSVSCLTSDQLKAIEEIDLSNINLSGVNPQFYKELYLDTVLLMYYLYSRPMDIFSLKKDNIKKCKNGYYVEYLPMKKKNSPNALREFVKCPINNKALQIIQKYDGVSKAGYLLPFSENQKYWNLADPQQYHTRYNRCNCMLGKVNRFLKKIGEALDISFENDTFSMYVFRHTAISLAITERAIPPIIVAKMAGTSLREIERSYMDHTINMFDYI